MSINIAISALEEWWRTRRNSGCFDANDRHEMEEIIAAFHEVERNMTLIAQVREAIAILEGGTDYERMHVSGILKQGLPEGE